ncbi:MAG: NUDIX hydrolase N-terminal domain-containing protein [Bacilli bacterium]|jgi:8-oxo-dGTP diphosphatase
MNISQFYEFIVKIHSIAKIGMVYSKDPYAIANYEEINQLSHDMLEQFVNVKFERPSYFSRDIYPTPNVSVRTIVFDGENRVLLVREAKDGCYSLPGGWCDLYESPSEAARKECLQEAGAQVEVTRLVGLLNRTPEKGPLGIPEYMAVFLAGLVGPLTSVGFETTEAGFYPLDRLPPLSRKVSEKEVHRMIDAARSGAVIFD